MRSGALDAYVDGLYEFSAQHLKDKNSIPSDWYVFVEFDWLENVTVSMVDGNDDPVDMTSGKYDHIAEECKELAIEQREEFKTFMS